MDNLLRTNRNDEGKTCQGVPALKTDRDQLAIAVADYVAKRGLTPPLSMEEILGYAEDFLKQTGVSSSFLNFVAVLIGNNIWKDTVGSIPYARRVLFIPQCLRRRDVCLATHDQWGLICAQCGACPIFSLQSAAEKLGYTVLIAEGTTLVTQMLVAGKVDAVIGVSCLSVLEKAFPQFQYNAIPAMAVPLYQDGCSDTQVDRDWVMEILENHSEQGSPWRIDFDNLKNVVNSWFATDYLSEMLQVDGTETEMIATAYLSESGKRWRPFLTAAVYQALSETTDLPVTIGSLAVAVECFHKASLIHDDIEDDDDLRNGEPALHCRYNLPIALNIGDLLLGEGYRLIAQSYATPQQIHRLLAVAALGHRRLSLGQGEELLQMLGTAPYSSAKVIEIFKLKTAPAFAVAANFGAIMADADETTIHVLNEFSTYLGVAYQIKDDIDDFFSSDNMRAKGGSGVDPAKPSLVLSLLYENADPSLQSRLTALWKEQTADPGIKFELMAYIHSLKIREGIEEQLDDYKQKVFQSLNSLKNYGLKSLLYRVAGRILQ